MSTKNYTKKECGTYKPCHNKYKVIPHAKRMEEDNFPYANEPAEPVYANVPVKLFDEKTRRKVVKYEKRVIDNVSKMKHYRCSDFALDNLIEIGSPLLGTSSVLSGDTFTSIDNISKHLSTLKTE